MNLEIVLYLICTLDFVQIWLPWLMLSIFMILNLVSLTYSEKYDAYLYRVDSCLGRYDGQVYEALMERAQLNPTNRHKVKNSGV